MYHGGFNQDTNSDTDLIKVHTIEEEDQVITIQTRKRRRLQ